MSTVFDYLGSISYASRGLYYGKARHAESESDVQKWPKTLTRSKHTGKTDVQQLQL